MTTRYSVIVSITPNSKRWLVGHAAQEVRREPFGTPWRTVAVQIIPHDARPPFTEGGNSAIVHLSCGHMQEWERPASAAYTELDAWVRTLASSVGRRRRCRHCERVQWELPWQECVVHCFFSPRCPHVVRSASPQEAHDQMEQHYTEKHDQQIKRLLARWR